MEMEKRIDSFLSNFTPSWGYRDLETAITAYDEAGKTIDNLAEDIQAYAQDVYAPGELDMDTLDICAIAYDTLHQEARTEIEGATGKDICNDSPYDGINVYGNYMCTTLDGDEKSMKALAELIETIPNRSKVVEWLYNQVKA